MLPSKDRGFRRQSAHSTAARHERVGVCRTSRISEKYLSDVAGHGNHVHLKRQQRVHVTNNPTHSISTGLSAGHIHRGCGRIDTDNLSSSLGKHAGKGPCPAPNVQHLGGAEFVNDVAVQVEIRSVAIQDVIDLGQARQRKVGIGHRRTMWSTWDVIWIYLFHISTSRLPGSSKTACRRSFAVATASGIVSA